MLISASFLTGTSFQGSVQTVSRDCQAPPAPTYTLPACASPSPDTCCGAFLSLRSDFHSPVNVISALFHKTRLLWQSNLARRRSVSSAWPVQTLTQSNGRDRRYPPRKLSQMISACAGWTGTLGNRLKSRSQYLKPSLPWTPIHRS